MKNSILLLLIFWSGCVCSQQLVCTAKDSLVFNTKIASFKEIKNQHLEESLMTIATSFLGSPYLEKTLEIGETESLVVNLSGFDCTTFVENVLAFNLTRDSPGKSFENFTDNLETIRYRNGKLDGYPSRLHYFTDWIKDNEKLGLVKDITNDLGGIMLEKSINFMGTHRNLYPFLADEENFRRIRQTEAELAKEELCYLPQNQIVPIESQLRSGDIIALATSIKGLDVTHTGFAIKRPNGRIHLIHASSSGEVKISKEPLVDYLKKIKSNIGIIVARPL